MGMCVWVCVYGYVCMGMCVWVCVYGYVCMGMCVWVCVYGYVCMGMCAWVCVHGYVCMGVCACVFVCMAVCVWMYGCLCVCKDSLDLCRGVFVHVCAMQCTQVTVLACPQVFALYCIPQATVVPLSGLVQWLGPQAISLIEPFNQLSPVWFPRQPRRSQCPLFSEQVARESSLPL